MNILAFIAFFRAYLDTILKALNTTLMCLWWPQATNETSYEEILYLIIFHEFENKPGENTMMCAWLLDWDELHGI